MIITFTYGSKWNPAKYTGLVIKIDWFLGPSFDNPKSLSWMWTRRVWGVLWDIHLCLTCHKVVVSLWTVVLFVLWLGAVTVWPPYLNSCCHDTYGDLWVLDSRSTGRMTTTLRDGHVLIRVVSRLIRISVFPSGFWFLGYSIKTLQRERESKRSFYLFIINNWVSF